MEPRIYVEITSPSLQSLKQDKSRHDGSYLSRRSQSQTMWKHQSAIEPIQNGSLCLLLISSYNEELPNSSKMDSDLLLDASSRSASTLQIVASSCYYSHSLPSLTTTRPPYLKALWPKTRLHMTSATSSPSHTHPRLAARRH